MFDFLLTFQGPGSLGGSRQGQFSQSGFEVIEGHDTSDGDVITSDTDQFELGGEGHSVLALVHLDLRGHGVGVDVISNETSGHSHEFVSGS